MPNLGDKRSCRVDGCKGVLTWQVVRGNAAVFVSEKTRQVPEPLPDYLAWVCSSGFHTLSDDEARER
jgi:hypothetical protein